MSAKIKSINVSLEGRARVVIRRIGFQFGDTPHEQLMFSIVAKAIGDLTDPKHRHSACLYLTREMPHAEWCGVNSVWIREQVIKAGFILDACQPITSHAQ